MSAPATLDAVVLGAGAAGMMCAAHAAARGGRVLVIDHARAPGEKIRISGGGRCNFTNIHCAPDRFISANRHFAKSALRRYTPADFIALVDRHRIGWHEKTLGQLFCDDSAKQIVTMMVSEMAAAGAEMRLGVGVEGVERGEAWRLRLTDGTALQARNLVVATGGKSIPKMGATGLGYRIAEQFGLAVTETRPGLVPLTFGGSTLEGFRSLAGVAVPVRVACGRTAFEEAMLFTHRGLSGPAILQISSYWREGCDIAVDLAPGVDALAALKARKAAGGGAGLASALADMLPRRLAAHLAAELGADAPLAALPDARLAAAAAALNRWTMRPTGSEGYRTAEVTVGGVDTRGLDSATMQARAVPGLYFVGEVVDVTGWLGGYNFQWAWASGWAAGTAIAAQGWP
ncbi:MAG: NAD(P)/FAD-dependent oxidoreductase [Rubrimonas sp.]